MPRGQAAWAQRVLLRAVRTERVPISVYLLLVNSLFGTIGAFMTLSIAGCMLAALVCYNQPGLVSVALCLALLLTTGGRIVLFISYRQIRRSPGQIGLRNALNIEAAYAAFGVALMASISLTSSYGILSVNSRLMEAFCSSMVLAIGAIIGSRSGGRPMIARWQTVSLCLPYGITLLVSNRAELQLTGVWCGG